MWKIIYIEFRKTKDADNYPISEYSNHDSLEGETRQEVKSKFLSRVASDKNFTDQFVKNTYYGTEYEIIFFGKVDTEEDNFLIENDPFIVERIKLLNEEEKKIEYNKNKQINASKEEAERRLLKKLKKKYEV